MTIAQHIPPSIPKDLVEYLDTLHSARVSLPRTGDSERDIWIKVGKRELVETLLQMRKDQETGADQGFPHVLIPLSAGDPGSSGSPGSAAAAPGSHPSPADRLGRFSE